MERVELEINCDLKMIFSRQVAESCVLEEISKDHVIGVWQARNEAYDGVMEWKWTWSIAAVLVQVARQAFR